MFSGSDLKTFPSNKPDQATMVIFGASGDLTKRMLIPSLFDLYVQNQLPETFQIIGSSRTKMSHDQFRLNMSEACTSIQKKAPQTKLWDEFSKALFYIPGDLQDENGYKSIDSFIKERLSTHSTSDNRLYYFSVAPQFHEVLVNHLGKAGMASEEKGWKRIIVEKPFGTDLKSAQRLNASIHKSFSEDQIFRIDHYLGKETVQNILVFRFGNSIFEPLWNRNYIDHVQITVSEELGIGDRASYYDKSGVVRDILQNHVLQLMTLTAMEPPIAFEANALRDEKVKVLRAIRPADPSAVDNMSLMAQYSQSQINGKDVLGYLDEPGVPKNSRTPSYALLKLFIDNWRWQNVPFYLRSGKRMTSKVTEIVIEFKCPPHLLFSSMDDDCIQANTLNIRIQPDEGIHLKFLAKVPGAGMEMSSVDFNFYYKTDFEGKDLPTAYERLLMDAIQGDASLFARSDEIEQAWKIIDPIIKSWDTDENKKLAHYPAGSWGPVEADEFMDVDNRYWHPIGERYT
jgi:glucose-6-phosphate 1-dehydrogenase